MASSAGKRKFVVRGKSCLVKKISFSRVVPGASWSWRFRVVVVVHTRLLRPMSSILVVRGLQRHGWAAGARHVRKLSIRAPPTRAKNTPPPLPKRQPVDSVTTSATMGTTTTTSTSTAVSNAENCFQVAGEGVAWWLCGCAGLVAGIVAVGGLTRLTRSGLSMVDWKPHGGLPPSGDEEWTVEFEKYKAFPEYQRSDKSMTLSDFKFIYFMEWGHRMLGRTVGLAFVLPAAVFAARGRLTGTLAKRCIGLGALGAAQGAIGWWMVKSGLAEDLLVNAHEPRVSPYRLTVHLTMAFSLYAGLVWTATDIFRATRPQLTKIAADVVGNADIRAALRSLSRRSHMAAGFIGLTVVAGALVAGNDAGFVSV